MLRNSRPTSNTKNFQDRLQELEEKYKGGADKNEALRFKVKQYIDSLNDNYNIVGMEYGKLSLNPKTTQTQNPSNPVDTQPLSAPIPIIDKKIDGSPKKENSEDDRLDEYKRQKEEYLLQKEITMAKNKLIKQENHRRNINARDRVSKKIEIVNRLMEYVKIIPPAPNVPQIFSIGGGQQYPIDFNMKVQIMNDQDKASKKLARKQEIERELITPLSNLYVRLNTMRADIKRLRERRDELKDSLKDVDEEHMDDDEIENLIKQKEDYK